MSPNRQRHRGRHPGDEKRFGAAWIPKLREAVADLSWLYTRGYADKAALKIVGDHFQFDLRQRAAVRRSACADGTLENRRKHRLPHEALAGEILAIDGYNLLITIENALSGGILIRGRDGCIRDLASLHGSYRRVEETLPAIRFIGEKLAELRPSEVRWYFDAPISNSGRLRAMLLAEAAKHEWPWQAELPPNPDPVLAASDDVVVTADSAILDQARRWANLGAWIVDGLVPRPEILDLGGAETP